MNRARPRGRNTRFPFQSSLSLSLITGVLDFRWLPTTIFLIMPAQRTTRLNAPRPSLYDRVKRGILMPSCSRCERRGTECRVAKDSARCAECILAGGNVKCDVLGPSSSEWAALERAENKIVDEVKQAEEAQAQLFLRLHEQQTKLLRLRKQQEYFRNRAAEMLRRGLKSMDELDAAEAADRLALGQSTPKSITPPVLFDEHFEPFSPPPGFFDDFALSEILEGVPDS
jgi:hypothetical protein